MAIDTQPASVDTLLIPEFQEALTLETATPPRAILRGQIRVMAPDEYSVYREQLGNARGIDGRIINKSKADMTSILEQAASVGSQYLSLPKYERLLKKPRELPNPLLVSQNLQHIGEIKLKRWLLKLLQPKRGCLMTSIESWMQLITLSTTILHG